MYSDLLRRWTLHKSIPINKQLLSELCSAFGLVLAKPSPNKLICFSYAVLLFVVEWRQNLLFVKARRPAILYENLKTPINFFISCYYYKMSLNTENAQVTTTTAIKKNVINLQI